MKIFNEGYKIAHDTPTAQLAGDFLRDASGDTLHALLEAKGSLTDVIIFVAQVANNGTEVFGAKQTDADLKAIDKASAKAAQLLRRRIAEGRKPVA